jgi:CheY-like chemotaxis protein
MTVVEEHAKRAGQILVVDDDNLFRESLVGNLIDAGFTTLAFAEAASALRHLTEFGKPDIILLDWKMPRMTGIDFLAELRRTNVATPVVFLTVLGDQIYEEVGPRAARNARWSLPMGTWNCDGKPSAHFGKALSSISRQPSFKWSTISQAGAARMFAIASCTMSFAAKDSRPEVVNSAIA